MNRNVSSVFPPVWHSHCVSLFDAQDQTSGNRQEAQMINTSLEGSRCRATREIRTSQGVIRRSTGGVIQYDMENLGRHLIRVQWDCGMIDYAYPMEIEILGQTETAVAVHA
jgi:hypothetical protein